MNKLALSLLFALLYAVLNISGSAIIKAKLKKHALVHFSDWVNFLFTAQIITAFALIFVSALLMMKALSFSNFTFIIPIATGINFVITVIVGYYLFQEKLNVVSFVGFGLILLGIIILSLNNLKNA